MIIAYNTSVAYQLARYRGTYDTGKTVRLFILIELDPHLFLASIIKNIEKEKKKKKHRKFISSAGTINR